MAQGILVGRLTSGIAQVSLPRIELSSVTTGGDGIDSCDLNLGDDLGSPYPYSEGESSFY